MNVGSCKAWFRPVCAVCMATAWLIGTVPPAGAQEPGEFSISIRPGVSVPLPISIGA